MNETTPLDPSKQFVAAVIPLLKEYLEKLRSIAEEAQRIREVFAKERLDKEKKRILTLKYDLLTQLFKRLSPPATQLAQEVSQRIEHGKLDELDRVELMLRLAEYEHALLSLPRVFSMGPLAA
ncbi:MAG TPA: hypothetical protein VN688_22720 [Gemmataceae bacterium]|nr:hypothetical protein [Gemmataceae bacterium]